VNLHLLVWAINILSRDTKKYYPRGYHFALLPVAGFDSQLTLNWAADCSSTCLDVRPVINGSGEDFKDLIGVCIDDTCKYVFQLIAGTQAV
jgi:hypothetical protein